jgi:hypothetical protein
MVLNASIKLKINKTPALKTYSTFPHFVLIYKFADFYFLHFRLGVQKFRVQKFLLTWASKVWGSKVQGSKVQGSKVPF